MSMRRAPKPVIAQVHGWCVGGGSEMALCADLVIASDDAQVAETAQQLAGIPSSQLAAMKMIVNQAYDNMGLAGKQLLGPILDGLMRNTSEAHRFIELAARDGVAAAVAERDAPFGDYSQAPADRRPDPSHVINP